MLFNIVQKRKKITLTKVAYFFGNILQHNISEIILMPPPPQKVVGHYVDITDGIKS
jgi:hypothetical protein